MPWRKTLILFCLWYARSMKALVIYRPDSEQARSVEEFIRNFRDRTGRDIELINIDSKDGLSIASLYDIMQHPAVLVTQDDGALVKDWVGDNLPLIDDVAGYLAS